MAEITEVANALFTNRKDWNNITDEDKEKFFFIFNRYFAKKYPEKAQLLNLKNIDKVSAFNLWFYFMTNKPYPKWFGLKVRSLRNQKFQKKTINCYYKRWVLKIVT